jgi:hypothetical protein
MMETLPMLKLSLSTLISPVVCYGLFMASITGFASDSKFLADFKNPPAEYHSSPLWVWNDDVSEAMIDQQLDMFQSQSILQAFVHPRPGLITPYLSERWLDLYAYAVKGAKKRGMLLHIYDENSYPSGFAGGHVPALHPDWRGKGIEFEQVDALPSPLPEDTLAVYQSEGGIWKKIDPNSGKGPGPYAIIRIEYKEPSPWNGGYPYVDLLQPGLTEAFLDITLGAYHKRFGEEFGKTVRSSFTDEPHLRPAGSLHWTPGLPELFSARYGYDLLEVLPSLFIDTGDFRKIRFDYFQLLLDEFIERWSKPYSKICEQYGIDFTGHYWEHGWPNPASAPDNMAMYEWHQMPAIDCLMNQYSEDVHAQFGNVRSVRELSSAANQMGRERRLCEIYGAGGWEMSFEDQKRIADSLGVLGVNFFDQHLTYMTLRGARKRDHPLSFSDHEPWWNHYHLLGDYLARLSYALSVGKEENRILVIEPTTSGWLLHRGAGESDALDAMGSEFQSFVTALSLGQVEYDLASERILRGNGKADAGRLVVGHAKYDLIILHRTCSNLSKSTVQLLKDYRTSGGKILLVGGRPDLIDGREAADLAALFPQSPQSAEAALLLSSGQESPPLQGIDQVSGYLRNQYSKAVFTGVTRGKPFHQFRQLGKDALLFLCNISKEDHANGAWHAAGVGVKQLDLLTGEVVAQPFKGKDGSVEVTFDLQPAGSCLYLISAESKEPAPPVPSPEKTSPASLQLKQVVREDPNVLTIDYCDYKVGDKAEKDVYFYIAQTAIYQAHGFERNPWDNAVQFEDRILKKDEEFGEGTGFSVTYHFKVDGFSDPPPLKLAVEQAERYTLTLNGQPLTPTGNWWLDRKFASLDAAGKVAAGDNVLTLSATHFSVHHEVEPVYVIGDFALKPAEHGWIITPPRALLYGPWKDQGLPFYSGKVRYEYSLSGVNSGKSLRVRLPHWQGVVASISANGGAAGLVAWPPYQTDLTTRKQGENLISVEVIGSLKNLLGPHHGNPKLGAAWPGSFKNAPDTGPPAGESYDTLPYGLPEAPEAAWIQEN